jgi:hypothetical protein
MIAEIANANANATILKRVERYMAAVLVVWSWVARPEPGDGRRQRWRR